MVGWCRELRSKKHLYYEIQLEKRNQAGEDTILNQ